MNRKVNLQGLIFKQVYRLDDIVYVFPYAFKSPPAGRFSSPYFEAYNPHGQKINTGNMDPGKLVTLNPDIVTESELDKISHGSELHQRLIEVGYLPRSKQHNGHNSHSYIASKILERKRTN